MLALECIPSTVEFGFLRWWEDDIASVLAKHFFALSEMVIRHHRVIEFPSLDFTEGIIPGPAARSNCPINLSNRLFPRDHEIRRRQHQRLDRTRTLNSEPHSPSVFRRIIRPLQRAKHLVATSLGIESPVSVIRPLVAFESNGKNAVVKSSQERFAVWRTNVNQQYPTWGWNCAFLLCKPAPRKLADSLHHLERQRCPVEGVIVVS